MELIAYGQGSGTYTNSIRINTRAGFNALADRLLVDDVQVTVFGVLTATGTITPGSSRAFKQDINELAYAKSAELIFDLEPVRFVYTADPSQPRIGFIAEDVPEVFGNAERNGVDAMGITAALTVVVQQQQQQLAQLNQLLESFAVDTASSSADALTTMDLGPNAFLTIDMFTSNASSWQTHDPLSRDGAFDNDFAESAAQRDSATARQVAFADLNVARATASIEIDMVSTLATADELENLWDDGEWLDDFHWNGVV